MILLPLVPGAEADAPEAVTTTVVQARPDMLGGAFVGGWQSGWVGMDAGRARLEAYGDLALPGGTEGPFVPEIYVLTADGREARWDWTVGRQRIDLPTRGRLLDGARASWSPSSAVRIEAWAGQARHVGLDGIASGAPIARLAATGRVGPVVAVAGAWGEAGGEAATGSALHPDLRVRFRQNDGRLALDAGALGALGIADGATVVERARLDLSLRPASGVRAVVYGEHREALDAEAALGPAILAAFAPDGVDEAGVGIGWSDARRSRLWGSASVQSWSEDEVAEGADRTGVRAELSWRPTCAPQSWCVTPSWSGVTGPGGVYQAFGAVTVVPVPDPVTLSVHGFVVPYRKPLLPWDTALVLGATGELRPSASFWSVTLGGELARDAVAPVDPRAWLAIRLEAK